MAKLLVVGALALGATAGLARAAQIIPVLAAGVAQPSGYLPLENSFSQQPAWNGTQPVSTTHDSDAVGSYGGRYAYVDFGPDYSHIQITQTWTRYRQYSQGNVLTWAGGYWTNVDPASTDTTATDPVAALPFTFENQTNLAYTGGNSDGSSEPWLIDSDLTASPVTPAGRYLVLQQLAAPQSRGEEYAFVGTINAVPEPATLTLLGTAAACWLLRRPRP